MVFVDPLEELNLPPGKLDSSHFWHGTDASLADRWSIESWPFLFLLPGGRMRPAGLVLLRLQSSFFESCISVLIKKGVGAYFYGSILLNVDIIIQT